MVVLIVLIYIVVGAVELSLWVEYPFKKTTIYLVLLVAAATLSVLLTLYPDLQPPSLEILANLWTSLWSGGKRP